MLNADFLRKNLSTSEERMTSYLGHQEIKQDYDSSGLKSTEESKLFFTRKSHFLFSVALVVAATASVVIISSSLTTTNTSSSSTATLSESQSQMKLGVCYSPFHHHLYGLPSNMKQVLMDDMKLMKDQDIHHIRTYYSNYMGINIASIAKEFNFQISMGIKMTYFHHAYAYFNLELQYAIEAAVLYTSNLQAIYIGNENLKLVPTQEQFSLFPGLDTTSPWGSVNSSEIIDICQFIREELKNTKGSHIPLGTVQRINEWLRLDAEVDELAEKLDVLGINIYPFFSVTTSTSPEEDFEVFKIQWQQLYQRFPSHIHSKFRLTETGYPTAGTPWFGHIPSIEHAQKYFEFIREWASTQSHPSYVFTFFDERYPMYPDVDQFFGLATADGHMKYEEKPQATPAPTPSETPTVTSFPTKTPTITKSPPPSDTPTPDPSPIFNTNYDAMWSCAPVGPSDDTVHLDPSYCDQVGRQCSKNLDDRIFCCQTDDSNSNHNFACPSGFSDVYWSSCNLSELVHSICANSSTNSINQRDESLKGQWVCKLSKDGSYSVENCNYVDPNDILAFGGLSCCNQSAIKFHDESATTCSSDDPNALIDWSYCSFYTLNGIITGLFSGNSTPTKYDPPLPREITEGQWFCQRGLSSVYSQEDCSMEKICLIPSSIKYYCCNTTQIKPTTQDQVLFSTDSSSVGTSDIMPSLICKPEDYIDSGFCSHTPPPPIQCFQVSSSLVLVPAHLTLVSVVMYYIYTLS